MSWGHCGAPAVVCWGSRTAWFGLCPALAQTAADTTASPWPPAAHTTGESHAQCSRRRLGGILNVCRLHTRCLIAAPHTSHRRRRSCRPESRHDGRVLPCGADHRGHTKPRGATAAGRPPIRCDAAHTGVGRASRPWGHSFDGDTRITADLCQCCACVRAHGIRPRHTPAAAGVLRAVHMRGC